MMNQLGDCELLERYATRSDREALGEVVRRHIGFVYAAALRQTRDTHAAEDVTQAAFIVLARRAGSIRSDAALPSWLFSVTRFAAASARRLEQRRAHHERRAAREIPTMTRESSSARDDLLCGLDDAIASLSQTDRQGVLLSYFHNKTFREVGAAMGISEEAARKRVTRAVERMRQFFAHRGQSISGTSLASVMTAQALIAAPPHLLAPAANVAIISHSFASSAIAEGVAKMLMWSALKPLAAAAAVVVVVSGVVVGQVALQQGEPKPEAAQLAAGAEPASADSVDLGDGVRAEFVAIAPIDGDDWHTPSGAPASRERVRELIEQLGSASVILSPPATHRALIRVTSSADADISINVAKSPATGAAQGRSMNDSDRVFIVHFVAAPGAKSADLEVRAATGEWKSVVDNDNHDNNFQGTWGVTEGGIVFTAMADDNGKPSIFVVTELKSQPWRVVAFDDADNVLATHAGNETAAGGLSTCTAVFDTDRNNIRRLEIQTRPHNKQAACRNCTLDPRQPTKPTIETKE